MAVRNPAIFLQGGQHSAENVRLTLQHASGKIEGVGQLSHLVPTASGTNVAFSAGDAWIQGDDSALQGMYHLINDASLNVPVPATGASARKDIIVARVYDPQYVGNRDPNVDAATIELITGTSTTYPSLPSTALLLCQLDVPASTSTITSAMITDKRVISTPRSDRQLAVVQPNLVFAVPNGLTPAIWPGAQPGPTLTVPTWASWVTMKVDISGILNTSGSALAAGIRVTVGGLAGLIQSQDTAIASGLNQERLSTVVAYDGPMPAAYRGTSQNFYTAAYHPSGSAQADSWTTLVYDITFREKL